jgi:hypothetical protein
MSNHMACMSNSKFIVFFSTFNIFRYGSPTYFTTFAAATMGNTSGKLNQKVYKLLFINCLRDTIFCTLLSKTELLWHSLNQSQASEARLEEITATT